MHAVGRFIVALVFAVFSFFTNFPPGHDSPPSMSPTLERPASLPEPEHAPDAEAEAPRTTDRVRCAAATGLVPPLGVPCAPATSDNLKKMQDRSWFGLPFALTNIAPRTETPSPFDAPPSLVSGSRWGSVLFVLLLLFSVAVPLVHRCRATAPRGRVPRRRARGTEPAPAPSPVGAYGRLAS